MDFLSLSCIISFYFLVQLIEVIIIKLYYYNVSLSWVYVQVGNKYALCYSAENTFLDISQ